MHFIKHWTFKYFQWQFCGTVFLVHQRFTEQLVLLAEQLQVHALLLRHLIRADGGQ